MLSVTLITVLVTSTSTHGDSSIETTTKRTNGVSQCVEPTDIMRRDHMNFLLHQRDKTVREGIRTKQHSLKGCVDCHVKNNDQGEFIPVNAPEQFCAACHTYTSVKIDCFECHATTPDVALSENKADTDQLAKSLSQSLEGTQSVHEANDQSEIGVWSFSHILADASSSTLD
ncbi:MAG: hypothetical protein GKR96_03455 [Gammaproteobacteria bacterium]|nr:hypothetical protein [Gammaproteobacteria bacterium]